MGEKRWGIMQGYIIIDTDGLDPIFGCLDELLVIGGNMIIFTCSVSHFDPHYHALLYLVLQNKHLYLVCWIIMYIMVIHT